MNIIFVQIEYDHEAAGFTTHKNVPFKFFFNRCFVGSENDPSSHQVYLIGHPQDTTLDRCPSALATNYLNFHTDETRSAVRNETSFTFDAFAFRDTDATFEITCTVELCAGDACPDQICD